MLDAASYGRLAVGISEHGAFEQRGEGVPPSPQPATNYSPGLPLLVAGIYELSGGERERPARLALALLGTLAVLFAYLIGRRLAGTEAGIVGALGVAVYPAFLEYQGMLMTEPLAATLLSGGVLAVLWANGPRDQASPARVLSRGKGVLAKNQAAPPPLPLGRTHTTGDLAPSLPRPGVPFRYLLPGVLLGATAMVRPEYLGIAVLIAVVVAVRQGRGGLRSCGVQAVVMLLGVVIVVAPWTVRNAVVLDRFVPLSTGGGQVLFAGNYLPSDGDPQRVGEEVLERNLGIRARLAAEQRAAGSAEPPTLERILAALAAKRHPGTETDVALRRMGRDQLWRNMRERPLEVAEFTAVKVGRVWGRGPREVMTKPVWAIWHAAIVALGLFGLGLLAWRRRWEALLFGAILLAVTLLSALLVASPRRVLVVMPLVSALAGYGAASLTRRWRRSAPAR